MADDPATGPITDRQAFETLYRERRGPLLARITALVRDRDRAEDITAAAFRSAWEKRGQFRGRSSLATWLYAIGFNEARRSWRQDRRSRHDPVERLESRRYAEPDGLSKPLEEHELRASVAKALERVPARFRRLLIDRYFSGHSIREIARRDGVPPGTVLSRLFAAKQALRRAWSAPRDRGDPMREDKVRQIAEEALQHLAKELQARRSEALKNYLAAMGRFHRYSWNNIMLIQTQRPNATRVAGYHTWHDLGRFVRKGEKGIMIFAPVVSKAQDADRAGRSQHLPSPETVSRVTGFRAAYVFDVEQTDGKPLPSFAATRGDPREYSDRLKTIVAEHGIALHYDASIAPADGVSSGGEIRIRPGLSAAEEFSVIAHELAHEMLHYGAERLALPKVVRETQAEAVAFVVSRGIGLETGTAAADYIALYSGDVKTLTDSLAAIQETSSRILDRLLPAERQAPARTVSAREPSPETNTRGGSRNPERPVAGPDPSGTLFLDR